MWPVELELELVGSSLLPNVDLPHRISYQSLFVTRRWTHDVKLTKSTLLCRHQHGGTFPFERPRLAGAPQNDIFVRRRWLHHRDRFLRVRQPLKVGDHGEHPIVCGIDDELLRDETVLLLEGPPDAVHDRDAAVHRLLHADGFDAFADLLRRLLQIRDGAVGAVDQAVLDDGLGAMVRVFAIAEAACGVGISCHHKNEVDARLQVVVHILELPEVGREGEDAICD